MWECDCGVGVRPTPGGDVSPNPGGGWGPIPIPDPAFFEQWPYGNPILFPPANPEEGTHPNNLGEEPDAGSPGPNSQNPNSGNGETPGNDDGDDEPKCGCTCVEAAPATTGSTAEESGSIDFKLTFGHFPQWAGMPNGTLRLYSKSVSYGVADGSMLFFEHLSQRRIGARVDSSAPNGNKVGLITENGFIRYADFNGQPDAQSFGGSESYYDKLRMVNEDGSEYSGPVENAPFFEEVLGDGNKIRYSGETGNPVSITTPAGVTVSAEELLSEFAVIKVNRQGEQVYYGNINNSLVFANNIFEDRPRQIWNRVDGMLDFPEPDVIDWYSPADVTNQLNDEGLFIIKEGVEPVKSWRIEPEQDPATLDITGISIRETRNAAQVSSRWSSFGEDGTLFVKGEGDNARCTVKMREPLDSDEDAITRPNGCTLIIAGQSTSMYAETKYTFKGERDLADMSSWDEVEVETAIRDIYKSYPFGTVKVSRTKAYGLPLERTWQYVYGTDESQPGYGKLTAIINPDGKETSMTYDVEGNLLARRTPWFDGAFRETRFDYACAHFNDRRTTGRAEVHIAPDGTETLIKQSTTNYEETDDIRRETVTRTAMGALGARVEVTEWYKQHECPYAIGRVRRMLHADGTETVYEYLETQHYEAQWLIIETQYAQGQVIPGKSERTLTYIDKRGDTTAVENMVHNGTGFITTKSRFITYDEAHRPICTLYGDGKFETTEWNCCGPLWTTNTDGIQTRYTYNAAKQLIREERDAAPVLENYNAPYETSQPPMTVTEYEYDGLGRRIASTTTIGEQVTGTSTAYDELGRTASTIDETGRETTYAYSEDGLETTVTLPTGARLITSKNEDGSIHSETGTGQQHKYYGYAFTAEGQVTQVRLDSPDGPLVSETIANGYGQTVITRKPAADGSGEMIETTISYNEAGRMIRSETQGMPASLIEYDELGNQKRQVTQIPCENGDQSTRTIRIVEMDTKYTDSIPYSGIPSDGIGNNATLRETVETVRIPGQQDIVTKRYALASDPLHDSALESLSFMQDGFGNWSYQKTENRYGNRCITSLSPGQSRESETITVDGETVRTTNAAGITTHYHSQYTPAGRTVTVIDGRGNATTTTYAPAGRQTSITDTAGNTGTIDYDLPTGQTSTLTNSLGHQTHFTYDDRGRKTGQYGTATQPVKWEYDNANRMVAMTTWREPSRVVDSLPQSGGDTTRWHYDSATGMLLYKEFADGTRTTYQYNRFGQPIRETNGNGETITYDYNPLTREMVRKTIGEQSGEIQQFSYNEAGKASKVVDNGGETTFSYDEMGLLDAEMVTTPWYTSETRYIKDGFGRNAGYDLLLDGTTIQSVGLEYDDAGRLATATLDGNEVFRYGYNEQLGHLESLTYPNGVTKTLTLEERRNVVASIDYLKSDGNSLYSENLEYDAVGQLIGRVDLMDSSPINQEFSYNPRGELVLANHTNIANETWQYDNIGNRIQVSEGRKSRGYESNALNQYTEITQPWSFMPEWDSAGNQIKLRTNTGEWAVRYNAENRATLFSGWRTDYQADDSILLDVAMLYDHKGRRVEKTIRSNKLLVERRRFVYMGYLPIAELRAVDDEEPVFSLVHSYMWDPSEPVATRPLALTCWENGNWRHGNANDPDITYSLNEYWGWGIYCFQTEMQTWEGMQSLAGRYYYIHDHNKNVKGLMDPAGELRGFYDYNAYGRMRYSSDGIARINHVGFSSEYCDRELDLVYYNYRHYNPTDGRWISRDPIAEEGWINLYTFLRNSPIHFSDIYGLYEYEWKIGPPSPDPNSDTIKDWTLPRMTNPLYATFMSLSAIWDCIDYYDLYSYGLAGELLRHFLMENGKPKKVNISDLGLSFENKYENAVIEAYNYAKNNNIYDKEISFKNKNWEIYSGTDDSELGTSLGEFQFMVSGCLLKDKNAFVYKIRVSDIYDFNIREWQSDYRRIFRNIAAFPGRLMELLRFARPFKVYGETEGAYRPPFEEESE